MRFADKVVVITGAGRGIGLAAARAFYADGAHIIAIDLRADADVTNEIRSANPSSSASQQAISMGCDVADHQQVKQTIDQIANQFGRIDILVTSAVFSERAPFHSIDVDLFRKTLEVSMMGTYYCVREVARVMIERATKGNMVLVGSPHAYVPVPNCMAYNMAKAACESMAKTAATELLPNKIRVNTFHPGWTDTPGERKFFSDAELHEISRHLPTGRLATADEMARGILFLADEQSHFMTGTSLCMDGGLNLPWRHHAKNPTKSD